MNKQSLKRLYRNEHKRNLVWDILSEDFNDAFERIIKELKELRSPLVEDAKNNRESIKEMVIEYGHDLETVTDMKKILDDLPNRWEDTCDHIIDHNN